MSKPLNVNLSREIAERIDSKATDCFNNAYQAALLTEGAIYVQGFLVSAIEPCILVEYGWIEFEEQIVDPTFVHLNQDAQTLYYFPAQCLSVKQLTAAVEEAQEDYPEDEPLPIYGDSPYEYYGELMLGGAEYLRAHENAEAKCRELKSSTTSADDTKERLYPELRGTYHDGQNLDVTDESLLE